MIERSVRSAHLGRVVDDSLVGNVVGIDFELEVGLRIVAAVVDEGFHHLVVVDVAIGALACVVVVVGLLERSKIELKSRLRVAERDGGQGKGCPVWRCAIDDSSTLSRTLGDQERRQRYVDCCHCGCNGTGKKEGFDGHLQQRILIIAYSGGRGDARVTEHGRRRDGLYYDLAIVALHSYIRHYPIISHWIDELRMSFILFG